MMNKLNTLALLIFAAFSSAATAQTNPFRDLLVREAYRVVNGTVAGFDADFVFPVDKDAIGPRVTVDVFLSAEQARRLLDFIRLDRRYAIAVLKAHYRG